MINDNSRGVKIQKENLLDNVKPTEIDGSGRFEYWKNAISIFRSSPVFGTGLNTYARIIMRDPNHGAWRYAHNCYLQMAAETGLLGLSCFLWMVFVLFWNSINSCHQIKDYWPLAILQGSYPVYQGF